MCLEEILCGKLMLHFMHYSLVAVQPVASPQPHAALSGRGTVYTLGTVVAVLFCSRRVLRAVHAERLSMRAVPITTQVPGRTGAQSRQHRRLRWQRVQTPHGLLGLGEGPQGPPSCFCLFVIFTP